MRGWWLVLLSMAALAAAGEARASVEPEEWLAAPSWKTLTAPVPRVTPPPRRELRPEPIPLPPAAFAVAGPALITFVLARLSVKRKRRRARTLRG